MTGNRTNPDTSSGAGGEAGRLADEPVPDQGADEFQAVLDMLPIGVFRATQWPGGELSQVNEAMAAVFGFPDVHALRGAPLAGLFADPAQGGEWAAELERAGQVDEWAGVFRRRDGTTFPGLVSARVFHAEGGQTARLAGSITDINQWRQAEEEARTHQTTLLTVLDAIPQAVFWKDRDGRYLGCNRVFARAVGLASPDQIVGRTDYDLPWPKAEAEAYRADDREVLATNRAKRHIEEPLQQAGGARLWIDTSKIPLPGAAGTPCGVLGVYEDITERRRVAEAGRVLREALEYSTDAIGLASPEGRHYHQNPAFTELFGDVGDDPTVMYADRAIADEVFRTIRAGGVWTGETRMKGKSGEVLDIFLRAYAVKNEQGVVTALVGVHTDITGRKRAEDRLRASEAFRQRVFESSRVPIVIMEFGTWRYLDCNPAAVAIYRFGSREATLGRTPQDVSAPVQPDGVPSAEAVARHIERALRDGSAVFEWRHRRPDGQEWDAEVHLLPFEVDGRRMMQFSLIDITDRKRAETALRHSELRLLTVLNSMESFIYIADMETYEVLFVNAHGRKVWGRDVVGQRCWAVLQGLDGPCPFCSNHRLVTSDGQPAGVYRWEFQNQVNGRWYECHDRAIRWTDGRLVRMEIAIDITDRKQAEDALRESERMYATLIENLPGFSYRCRNDRNWTMTFLSRGFQAVTGYPAEALLENAAMSFNDLIHPDWQPRIWSAWQDCLSRREPFEGEYPIRAANGETRWVWERGRGVFGEGGELLFLEGFITDTTDRQRAEEEQDKLRAQLSQAQKMESVGRLAGGVAHDFNNMLGVIIGNAELAMADLPPDSPQRVELLEIHKAAERSAELTRQLLAFARKQTYAPRVLDLNATVEGMLKMLRRLIGEDITLEWRPGRGLEPVCMDPSQIDQILANLCVNARDAIDGVGRVTIETSPAVLDEAYCAQHPAARPGPYAMLVVSDDGCGMDRQTLDRVFEPFFTTKAVGQGTGLGLSTVYGIVRQNDGFVNVYSEPGQGTAFRVYFPCQAGDPAGGAGEPAGGLAPVGQETILLVEDEPAILNMTKNMLVRQGYSVLTAAAPAEALRVAGQHVGDIHLLMTDVVMPEMNGRELARQLLVRHPKINRLFMSGYTANVIAHHGVLESGVHFIQKPFNLDELSWAVRRALGAGDGTVDPPAAERPPDGRGAD